MRSSLTIIGALAVLRALAPFGMFLFLLRPKIVACTIAVTVAGGAAAQAVSPSVVHTVRDMACAQEKERWQEAEMVDESLGHKPAYDVHHTVCALQFVTGGRWHKIEYRHTLHVSRRWGWSEVRDDSLSVMILQVEGIDVASDIYRWVMADRGCRGRVSFAVRDIFGGVSATDHFYLPPEDDGHSGMDGCVDDACSPVGLQNRDQWQQLYELVFSDALTRLRGNATIAVDPDPRAASRDLDPLRRHRSRGDLSRAPLRRCLSRLQATGAAVAIAVE